MPYKDPEKNRECSRKHYYNNKKDYLERNRRRKKETMRLVAEYKTKKGCALCPEKERVALDYHHPDSSNKEMDISKLYLKGWGQERIIKKLNECVVLCANCHRKVSAGLLTLPH